MSAGPRLVIVLSGKRKSGKDYLSDQLVSRLEQHASSATAQDKAAATLTSTGTPSAGLVRVVRLSGPLKEQYAKEHNLDFQELLAASQYKETYRADMIKWGEAKRNADPSFFCRTATAGADTFQIWIVSDARRASDLDYFRTAFGSRCFAVRVVASDAARESRGYVFTAGVDDAESECGLDGAAFDLVVRNDGEQGTLQAGIDALVKMALDACSMNA
ncbi:phosphomevalonate kinase [Capsaspora owczarzaki ATCC 30864]|uniref:Phosphomevalonate kinase n=1 Tax=Capsaspora owczarzaki (strain ATCC 30864) TaxID=595528 RepID=A0A0D2WT22_CAPO3|nr:phosphomevalonate kinase [Capsaspora owczarzaki ATCC 30864]KJE94698.1 phosphomevalonate kinase [Capsaspora owczarzaki ATCC 30864]|eukprot:XP_004346985.1 phosphomevalonate kinase [Capsaspora owczarzaki ATCC 30864]